jgi:aminoglycoside phosphotransferase (APT) family kinase protein
MGVEALLDRLTLERYLITDAPDLGVRAVRDIARFPNGLSSLSCRVDVDTETGPATWVLRAEPDFGVIPPYDIAAEAALVAKVGAAGLPVAPVVHVEPHEAAFGRRFALFGYVDGFAYHSGDPRLEADPVERDTVARRFVETLARVHQVEDHGLVGYPDGRSSALAFVAVCRQRLADTEVLPRPLLRHALDVLERRAPACERLVLLHGDYRLPNLKWRDGEIVGILDWELARIGDPAADVAFTQTVGAGPCAVEGALLDHYRDLTGFEIDDFRIAYYQLFELLKSCVIGMAGARDLLEGGSDLRLLSVAGLGATAEPIVSLLETVLDRCEVMTP